MPDPAQLHRSLNTVRTELDFLRDSGLLHPGQYQSIMEQLPHGEKPSPYVDPRFTGQAQQGFQEITQQAQNPQNPAHPDNPKHHEWAKSMASKFGNAMVWGAGATFGSDMINDAMRKV